MPSALKRPTLDELYRRLRDLDYTQVDERMAVMLNAILHWKNRANAGSLQQKRFYWSATPLMGYPTKSKPDGCPGMWMEE